MAAAVAAATVATAGLTPTTTVLLPPPVDVADLTPTMRLTHVGTSVFVTRPAAAAARPEANEIVDLPGQPTTHQVAQLVESRIPQTPQDPYTLVLVPDGAGSAIVHSSVAPSAAAQPLVPGTTYRVLAVYTTTPVDLYRTVLPTDSLPTVASDIGNNLSGRAPVATAVATADEFDRHKSVAAISFNQVHGISLQSTHPTRCRANAHQAPQDTERYLPMTSGQPRPRPKEDPERWSYVDLGVHIGASSPSQGLNDAVSTCPALCGPFGVLAHPRIQDSQGTLQPDCDVLARDGDNNKLLGYFCLKMPAGTDLDAIGMAVAYDNVPPGHFTLIPWPTRGAPQPAPAAHLVNPGVWPQDLVERQVARSLNPGAQPVRHAEFFDVASRSVFPFASKKFAVHCFQTRAGGECAADDPDRDEPVLQAARLLHEQGTDDEELLQVFSDHGFVLDRVPPPALRELAVRLRDFDGRAPDGLLDEALERLSLAEDRALKTCCMPAGLCAADAQRS